MARGPGGVDYPVPVIAGGVTSTPASSFLSGLFDRVKDASNSALDFGSDIFTTASATASGLLHLGVQDVIKNHASGNIADQRGGNDPNISRTGDTRPRATRPLSESGMDNPATAALSHQNWFVLGAAAVAVFLLVRR